MQPGQATLKVCQGSKSGEEPGLQLLSEQVDTLVAESQE